MQIYAGFIYHDLIVSMKLFEQEPHRQHRKMILRRWQLSQEQLEGL